MKASVPKASVKLAWNLARGVSQPLSSIKPVTLELNRLRVHVNLIFKMLSGNCHSLVKHSGPVSRLSYQLQPDRLPTFRRRLPHSLSPDWNQRNENSQTAHKMSHYYESTHYFYRYFLSVTGSLLRWQQCPPAARVKNDNSALERPLQRWN